MRPVAHGRARSLGAVVVRRLVTLAACAALAGTVIACAPPNPTPSASVSETLVPASPASPAAAIASPGIVP